MKTRRVSIIIFYDKEGNLLLQDRRKRSKWGEEYGIFGGAIEEDETPEEALVREIKEEIGITLTHFEFFKEYSQELKSINLLAERHVYLAPIPPLSEISCQEGNLLMINYKLTT